MHSRCLIKLAIKLAHAKDKRTVVTATREEVLFIALSLSLSRVIKAVELECRDNPDNDMFRVATECAGDY